MSIAYGVSGQPGSGVNTVVSQLEEVLQEGGKGDVEVAPVLKTVHLDQLREDNDNVTLIWVAATDETRRERTDEEIVDQDVFEVKKEQDASLINEGSKNMLRIQVERVVEITYPEE